MTFAPLESGAPAGLLAVATGVVVMLVLIVVVSLVADWLKKRNPEDITDSFEPYVFKPQKPDAADATGGDRHLSAWEEEIQKLLRESSGTPSAPPPIPEVPIRRSPPPLPVHGCDPLANETEGRADQPVPTYLASMEPPDAAYDRGSHLGDRVRERLRDAGDHSDASKAFARVDLIDEAVAARLAAAGNLHRGETVRPVHGGHARGNAELQALVAALRQPAHARGAMVASIILGPPKALER